MMQQLPVSPSSSMMRALNLNQWHVGWITEERYPLPAAAEKRDHDAGPYKPTYRHFPFEMLPHNPCSDIGFAEALKWVSEGPLKIAREARIYMIICMDIDLYQRFLKVVQSIYNLFPELRIFVSIPFGLWHVVKHLYDRIWKEYFLTVFAPSLRHMIPATVLRVTKTHQLKVHYFALLEGALQDRDIKQRFDRIRVAYKLHRYAEVKKAEEDGTDVPIDNGVVRHVLFLVDFLLPLVSTVCCVFDSRIDFLYICV
jgi:hypothetical protein